MNDISAALKQIQNGGMVLVVDDEDRENEGDLIAASEFADEQTIAFMAIHGRGLICMAIEESRAIRLQLPQMATHNSEGMKTAFTVSVDARTGTSTGISPADRARTVETILNPRSRSEDLLRPGHLFPLVARAGGVLERPGHTEAAVDLARLAGLKASGVICEVIDDDGSMARLPRLKERAREWNIPLISIQDLIRYRKMGEELARPKNQRQSRPKNQPMSLPMSRTATPGKRAHAALRPSARASMPLETGEFDILAFPGSGGDEPEAFALVLNMDHPPEADEQAPLVRIHSECLTGESLGSLRCDCGFQLQEALRQIKQEGRGVLVYLRQEGRGIGLMNKIKAYELQDRGEDTMDANLLLGHPADGRSYVRGAKILQSLGVCSCRLLTNNPEKMKALKDTGIEVSARLPIEKRPDRHSISYMKTKRTRFGHLYSFAESGTA